MDKQEFLDLIDKEFRTAFGDTVDYKYENAISGESIAYISDSFSIKKLIVKFKFSENGISPSSIVPSVFINQLEDFIEPVAKSNGLNYTKLNEHSIVYSTCDQELYGQITRIDNDDIVLERLLRKYFVNNIIPFFKNACTVKDLAKTILNKDINDIVNIGIGSDYPLNILKAITIAKWCKNEEKYNEYKTGLQTWINEDRNDPNYSNMCDSYQGALNELTSKLEGNNDNE